MNPRRRSFFLAIALLAVAGMAVSAVALHSHYGKDKSAYCDFGETFNCDLVNRSVYSEVLGVPVALLGLLGYGLLLVLATFYRGKAKAPALLLCAALCGLAFALYLTYIEAFVLGVWCVLCLASLVMIVAITALASVAVFQGARNP